jgi:hypothetical protein
MRGGALRLQRRGAAIVAVVTLLSVVNITLIASFRSVGDQADVATLRIESERAFYAAESGVMLLIGDLQTGGIGPASGDALDIGSQRIVYDVVPDADTGAYEILGQSGRGFRRLLIEIE